MPRIPQSFIDDLLARVDIVEIINSRVQLRKTGSNFSACCPFHNEKTPSFTVSPTKQFYYCFGCGAHGNAIGFLMNFDNMEFIDAIETLAANVGLEVPHEASKHDTNNVTSDLYDLLAQASTYYQQQLRQSETAVTYLKGRELSGEISKCFNIGYAPNGWNNVLTAISTENKEKLVTAGMLLNKNDKFYDRFRDRIMFPIRDQRGRVIGFGGRTLGDDTPKYLNSPETPVFHKGSELYGLYEAKQSRNLNQVVVVEGYMDVVALAQHGINYAVATLGTATTSKHIQKLLRYTTNIIFCFDGDNAGKTAAWRALENSLPLMRDEINLSFLFLPENEDPDSQVRKEGKDKFEARINSAMPLSEFFFNHLAETINLNTVDGRANLAQKALNLLNKIPNGIFKQLMLEKLAQIIHCNVDELGRPQGAGRPQGSPLRQNEKIHNPVVLAAVKLLLHNPTLAQHIEDTKQLADIDIPGVNILIKLLALSQQPDITIGAILEHWRDKPEEDILAKLAAEKLLLTDLKNEFTDTIKRIYEQGREQIMQKLMQKAAKGAINTEEKKQLQKLIIDAKLKTN